MAPAVRPAAAVVAPATAPLAIVALSPTAAPMAIPGVDAARAHHALYDSASDNGPAYDCCPNCSDSNDHRVSSRERGSVEARG